MADVAFIIPQKLEDLCTYTNERYVVSTDYSAAEVNDRIAGQCYCCFVVRLSSC